MKKMYDPQFVQQLIAYNPETGEASWRERTPAMYLAWATGCTPDAAERRARWFNQTFAGKPLGERPNLNIIQGRISLGAGSPTLRKNMMAIVWMVATGKLPKHQLFARDGDVRNMKAENIVQATPAVGYILRDPLCGLFEYETTEGIRYYWEIQCAKKKTMKRKGFTSLEEAREARDATLKNNGLWYAQSLAQAMKE